MNVGYHSMSKKRDTFPKEAKEKRWNSGQLVTEYWEFEQTKKSKRVFAFSNSIVT